MNKITTIAALAAIASVSLSANATGITTGLTEAATTATKITVSATTDTSAVGGGLKENVALQISIGNVAVVSYNATSNTYGYAAGNTKGKGHVFSGASSGGAIVDTATSGGAVPAVADCTTAANTASGGS